MSPELSTMRPSVITINGIHSASQPQASHRLPSPRQGERVPRLASLLGSSALGRETGLRPAGRRRQLWCANRLQALATHAPAQTTAKMIII